MADDLTTRLGGVQTPTVEELESYARSHHLHLDRNDLERQRQSVRSLLDSYEHVEALSLPGIPLTGGTRDPGFESTAELDPLNAVIRFCHVPGDASGNLAGLTVGVKDCIAVAGVPMTNGSRRMPVVVPTYDAVVIERLLSRGASVTAKTNMDDLGLGMGEGSAFGPVRNPLNPDFSTGGSSSGSAAAVGSGIVDVALGVDSGGSIRVPAAWCGLVGMKPTHGLVPAYGLTYIDHTIDHIGPITRTVHESARVLDVIAGHDWRDPQWVRATPEARSYGSVESLDLAGLRIGIPIEADNDSAYEPAVTEAFSMVRSRLEAAGAELVQVSIPLWNDAMAIAMATQTLGIHVTSSTFGMGSGHLGRIDPERTAIWAAQSVLHADDLPSMLVTMLLAAEHVLSRYQGVPMAKAQNARLELRRQIEAVLDDVDVVITPTSPTTAYRLATEGLSAEQAEVRLMSAINASVNTVPLNLSGNPAITVPCGFNDVGVGIGVQLIGPHYSEELLYGVALSVEAQLRANPRAWSAGEPQS